MRDGEVVAAAQEERFSRLKHDSRLPIRSYRFCLEAGGVAPGDIACLAYYELPHEKRERQLWAAARAGGDPSGIPDPEMPERSIRERLGYEGTILTFPHHLSHAASAFCYSGFEDSALLIVDGVGEWATTSYGRGQGRQIELFDEVRFPHSLGLLYSTLTAYLGFEVNDGEGKVMGLAPYGEPRFVDPLRNLISSHARGGFELDLRYFDFITGSRMYSPELCDLLGAPARARDDEITAFHRNVACSVQTLLEEVLLEQLDHLARCVDSPNLCLAGGVALNCVANGRLLRDGPFERLFVQPAAGDAGACLGAAALARIESNGGGIAPLPDVFSGPAWSPAAVERILDSACIPYTSFLGDETSLVERVAELLSRDRIVAWFQGSMEFGPRALGARSILANPADSQARDRLNRIVKRREPFRPFAPSVLEERAGDYFELDHPSPFMLETCRIAPSGPVLPAITHVDGSARPQTVRHATQPLFASLLEAFGRRTGHPVLLNTSFNVAGEPIVATPVDALLRFAASEMDALAIGEHLIEQSDLGGDLRSMLAAWQQTPGGGGGRRGGAPDGGLYTFV